jgi:hypothetical protein
MPGLNGRARDHAHQALLLQSMKAIKKKVLFASEDKSCAYG